MRQLSCVALLLLLCSSLMAAVQCGAGRVELWSKLLNGKRVALVVNHTATMKNGTHLLDTMLALGVDVRRVFAPEHGFRGDADAGEKVADGKDSRSGLPIVSLYGANRRPSAQMVEDVDVVVFDIQDVGARFYTYISTMLYVMERCADSRKEFVVLDRPNPNDYVDGPILEPKYTSFVGALPIPVTHAMTVGELARMIVGEGWMQSEGKELRLSVVPMSGWKHGESYSLPIAPSPNLPNDKAVNLYASLCLFEGTCVSVGRGTKYPFQQIGAPDKRCGSHIFTPRALVGSDKNPMNKDLACHGHDLRNEPDMGQFSVKYLVEMYHKIGSRDKFFTNAAFFDKLAGTAKLREQIVAGKSEMEIRKSWQQGLEQFKSKREKYLMY